MKNTFSLSKKCFGIFFLLFVTLGLSAQQKTVELNVDVYPLFIKPKSTQANTSFPLGAGVGADFMVAKILDHGFRIAGGLGVGKLWFKETDIWLFWSNDPGGSFYDRKFRMTDIELKTMFSKSIKVGKSSFVPTVGAGHSWFSGTEKYDIAEGYGETIEKHTGSLGNSFNLHFGLGYTKQLKSGGTFSLKPDFIYRFGKIESPNQNFATKSFSPHTLAVHINFLGLFFKNKPAPATKE
jgi:hypothetical protein